MYTRCPECDSAHVLNAALLARSRGTVRCGRCNRKFDALEQLFDEWPDPADAPPPAGARYRPPVLGSKQDLDAPFGPAYAYNPHGPRRRGLWLGLAFVLALATVAHATWTFRERLAATPPLRALMARAGLLDSPMDAPFRAPGQIRVVSRDLHSHPTRAGALVLSATFVSHAERAQAWPRLELNLLDMEGRTVATRRFNVDDYLPGRGGESDLLRPQVHVPVLLEFSSPGGQAAGFEIRFH